MSYLPNPFHKTKAKNFKSDIFNINQQISQKENKSLSERVKYNANNITKSNKSFDDIPTVVESINLLSEFYDEISDESTADEDEKIFEWYTRQLKKKVYETKTRLNELSNAICYSCESAKSYLLAIEEDHNATFCKFKEPLHRSIYKPWVNSWKFLCVKKCKFVDNPPQNHAHTFDCSVYMFEDNRTLVTRKTANVLVSLYPKFIWKIVGAFEDFINTYTCKYDGKGTDELVFETPYWNDLTLRSNYKNEVIATIHGKNIHLLCKDMENYFVHDSIAKNLKISSIYYINERFTKKGRVEPELLYGKLELIDRVDSIKIVYEPQMPHWINVLDTEFIGQAILNTLIPTIETSVLNLGCALAVISNILAPYCDKVIGLSVAKAELMAAQKISNYNKIYNSFFYLCNPHEIEQKIGKSLRNCISTAILQLGSIYGKNIKVIEALRKIPTIWQVLVIGSFKKEFHKSIIALVNKNSMGDPFLPVQGCVVDLSPTLKDKFEIMILFERKSVIKPTMHGLRPIKRDISIERETECQKIVSDKNLISDMDSYNLMKNNASQYSNKSHNIQNTEPFQNIKIKKEKDIEEYPKVKVKTLVSKDDIKEMNSLIFSQNNSLNVFNKNNALETISENLDPKINVKKSNSLSSNKYNNKNETESVEYDKKIDVKIKHEMAEIEFAKINFENDLKFNSNCADFEYIKNLQDAIKQEYVKKENYEYYTENKYKTEKEKEFTKNEKFSPHKDNFEKKRKYWSPLTTDSEGNPRKKLFSN